MTAKICVTVRGRALAVEVETDPPLGWRFWTFAGFPSDPVEPRPYGGSRGIPVAPISLGPNLGWLTAMELDGSAQVFTPHELFPCDAQDGAAEFGRAWLERHRLQPDLFGGAA